MKQRLSLLLALCLASAAWCAQIEVADVRVRADDNFDVDPTEAVFAMCSVKTGLTAEQADLQDMIAADVKALLATPNYSNVEAAIALADKEDAWVVIYTVSRRPQLAAEPSISGLNGELRLSKAEEAVNLKSNDRVDDAIASSAAGRLRAKLQEYGYVNAVVTYELRYADAPGYAYLTFLVTPNDERSIRDYTFVGNTVFDHDTLAGSFGWVPWWNPMCWFKDFPVTDSKLDDARATVLGVYTDAGYLDAEVSSPEMVQLEGKAKGRCDAVFTITEGRLYTVGDITVEGATIYPKEALEGAARTVLEERGATATSETLSALREAVEGYYGSRGYVDTYAQPVMVPRIREAVIDITYRLTEGEQAIIRAIEIRGNSITKDKVIRRELAIQPGEHYDSRLVKRSEARIRNLNYFQAESGVTSFTVKTGTPGERDLVFNVREERTGDYGFGVGISSVDHVFVYAKATQRNFDIANPSNWFRGGGQRASAEAELGSRRQTVAVNWTQPWLFDVPLSLSIDAYRRMRWYDHYDEIRTGAAFTLSWKPAPIPTPFGDLQLDRIGLRYLLENVEYDDVESGTWFRDNGSPFRFTDEKDGVNSKLRAFWQENHRNKPFFPTAGWESLLYADVGLGGEAKDYGLGFNITKWWTPWFDHTVMTRLRFDAVEAYSGDVPMFDRLFIGGGRTIRGFEYRDGGPKAWALAGSKRGDHVGIGGQTLWCATLEYSIPLISVLRFAVFTDIGAVSDDFMAFNGDLLWSAGCGLRLDLPGFPIRLDVAKPITNDDDTEEEVFTFLIGID